MDRGNRLEPLARDWVNKKLDKRFIPVVVQSENNPWLIASLDGYIDFPGTTPAILEIKCPGAIDHAIAMSGEVPSKYKAQLQHQMDLMGVESMVYVSFDGDEGIIIEVDRDENYCKELWENEFIFYHSIIDMAPPKPTERDWVIDNENEALHDAVAAYNAVCDEFDFAKDLKDKLKDEIVSNLLHPRVKVGKNRMQLIQKKGEIDYSKLITDLGIADDVVERYRKPSSQYWKIGY